MTHLRNLWIEFDCKVWTSLRSLQGSVLIEMRQETNNEMDLLLRRLGRRQDVLAPDNAAHLDPDELNAYAENALPAAARARYTEHLAECAPCRELVVQLSAAAGVVSGAQTVSASEPSGWKKFLAGLLSPMVLRYAVPALGLIVVAAIGFVIFRRTQPDAMVSQVQPSQSTPAAVGDVPASRQYVEGRAKPEQSKLAEETKSSKPVPTSTPTSESTAAAGKVEQNAAAPVAKPESQPEVARGVEPPSPKAPAPADERKQKSEDAARQKEADIKVEPEEVSKQSFELGKGDNKRAEPATMRSRAAKNKAMASDSASVQSAGPGASQPGAARERDDKDSSAETRSVSGRRFRKQRGIWVDTAYDASRDTVNLTRGSEYYRGLIADEPEIKNIADQLDGEIIVVWKGRAYRIR